jgi:hypothetical protein
VKVGIQPVAFNGWAEMVKNSPKKAELHLRNPDVIAVIALLDLYGPTIYPPDRKTAADRYEWAKAYLENQAKNSRFRQHFAVHDVEAWILSDPDVLPPAVRKKLPLGKTGKPETVNFDEPPACLLNRLYQDATNRNYKKRTYGEDLFRKLDPEVVWQKCPYFRKLADDLVYLTQKALKSPPS